MCPRHSWSANQEISLYDEIQRNLFVRFSSPTIFFVYVFFLVHISSSSVVLGHSIAPCVSPRPSSQGLTPTNTRVSTSPSSASTSSAHSGHGLSPCSLRTLPRTPSPLSASALYSPTSVPSCSLTRCTREKRFPAGRTFPLHLDFSRTRVWMRLMGSKLGGQGWPVPWERCLTMDVVSGMTLFQVCADVAHKLCVDAINTTVCRLSNHHGNDQGFGTARR